jgi:hypothetical protein
MNRDIVRIFTLRVLSLAQEDRATKVIVSPATGGVKYEVDGVWHNFSAPPAHILPGIVAELGRLAGLPADRFPKQGIIQTAFSAGYLRWKMQVESPEADCVLAPVAG